MWHHDPALPELDFDDAVSDDDDGAAAYYDSGGAVGGERCDTEQAPDGDGTGAD